MRVRARAFYGPLSGTTQVSWYQQDTILDLAEAEMMGIAVASAEPYASYLHFAPEDNQASTAHSDFYKPDAIPDTQPTAAKHWRH